MIQTTKLTGEKPGQNLPFYSQMLTGPPTPYHSCCSGGGGGGLARSRWGEGTLPGPGGGGGGACPVSSPVPGLRGRFLSSPMSGGPPC